jgi:hypothetical protein
VSFVNIDCDLYSSTRTVLRALSNRIVEGTTLYFDEMIGYKGWEQHEYRAFNEFVAENGRSFRYLGCADTTASACRWAPISSAEWCPTRCE